MESLWPQIQSGSESAFEELFMQNYEQLIRFASKYHHDYEEQREIVQQVFADLWCRRKEINISSSPKAYLYRTVRNRSLNLKRHEAVRHKHEEYRKSKTENTIDADQPLLARELQQKIQYSLSILPDRTQEIFRMSREEGLKYREIAEALEVSVKTVEFQMGKALAALRRELADYL